MEEGTGDEATSQPSLKKLCEKTWTSVEKNPVLEWKNPESDGASFVSGGVDMAFEAADKKDETLDASGNGGPASKKPKKSPTSLGEKKPPATPRPGSSGICQFCNSKVAKGLCFRLLWFQNHKFCGSKIILLCTCT